jgi:hypothetical protein
VPREDLRPRAEFLSPELVIVAEVAPGRESGTMTAKTTIDLPFPRVPNRMIDNAVRWQTAFRGFRVVGAVMSVLGAVLTWQAIRHLPVQGLA